MPSVVKGVVACTAIRHGGELEWNFAFKRFRESNVASEKATLLSSLTCTQESWILAKWVCLLISNRNFVRYCISVISFRMLEMCLNPAVGFRTQDALDVIKTLAENPIGRFMTFNFVREKWPEMTKM